jgi:hypothetical protein
MLRKVRELLGYAIRAVDGSVGQVDDFFLDDETWVIRYLVADLGNWLPGRKVLISPITLEQPDWEQQIFPVNLTKDQIQNSPHIDTDKPISRQQETALFEYYQWPTYWSDVSPIAAGRAGMPSEAYLQATARAKAEEKIEENVAKRMMIKEQFGDPNLRSTKQLLTFYLQTTDGQLGHVEDFLVDDEHWILPYLVADLRNWLPDKNVLIAAQWIGRVTWTSSEIHVDLSRKIIEDAPAYDPSILVSQAYETKLFDYYNQD